MSQSKKPGKIDVFFDGSSSGNPGASGGGVIIFNNNGEVIFSGNRFFGRHTNNEAEYLALLFALEMAQKLGYKDIALYTDSALLFSQLVRKFKVRAENLKQLYQNAQKKLSIFNWKIKWVPREKNREADRLAQKATKIGG